MANEIDLTGLEKQIELVQRRIFMLDKQLGAFTDDISKTQKYMNEMELGKATGDLEKMFRILRDKSALQEFAKGIERAGANVTQFIDVLGRNFSIYKNILSEYNGDSVISAFENTVKKIRSYQADISNAFKGSNEGIRQTFKVIKTEIDRLSNLQMPKSMNMQSIIKADQAIKNIDAVRERVEVLKMNLKDASKTFGGTGDNQLKQIITDLGAQLRSANAELRNMKTEIKSVETAAKGAASPWGEYKQKMREILPVYNQIEAHINKLTEVREMLKVNGKYQDEESKQAGSAINKQINALSKMIKPYKEMVDFERTRRSEMEASIGVVKTEQQIIENRKRKEQELLDLNAKLAAQETKGLTPLQRAEELDNMRVELIKNLLNLQEKASRETTSSALAPLGKQAESLEAKLKIVKEQLNALYAKYPAVQQSILNFVNPKLSFNADGTLKQLQGVQAEIVKIQNEYNLIKMNVGSVTDAIKNQISALQQEEEAARKVSEAVANRKLHYQTAALERQANLWREALQRQKENAEWARKASEAMENKKLHYQTAELERQANLWREALQRQKENAEWAEKHGKTTQQQMQKLVAQGSSAAIANYLKTEKSIESINKSLDGLRAAQERCNLATKDGSKRYAELGQQIKALEFMLGQNANLSSKFSSAISGAKNAASQIAMSFGIMTGVFGAANFVKQLYKITSEFQLQQRALGAIVQNTREANILFKQMQSLAVESPMKFMDLNRYAKQLAAFRIETNNLFDSLKMLGDISVGVGVDMDRLILAYGQVKAANYLRGQELRQFSEAGVNILGGLQEYYRETKNINMSINEIFDSVSKRKVLFEDVDAVLHRMTESGGEFYNMQLVQSQTLYGHVQKLGDLFQISMNNIGSSTSGVLLKMVKAVQFVIGHLREVITLFASWAAAGFINKIIRNFATLRAGAKALSISLREGWVVARQLGATRLTALITSIWNANAGMLALNAAIAIGMIVLGQFMARRAENKAKEEEIQRALIEEITEYNRRLREIRDLEKSYSKDPTFEGRLALLQQLIEKAKEFSLALKLDENITPANIDENFKRAKEQLEEYSKKVVQYKAILYDEDTVEAMENFEKVNILFAEASLSAEKMLDQLKNVYNGLSDNQKAALDEIIEIDEAFATKNKEVLDKIQYTEEEWAVERLKRLNAMSGYMSTLEYGFGDDVVYLGREAVEGLNDAEEKQMGEAVQTLQKFVNSYDKAVEKATKDLKPKIEKILTAEDFVGLDEDEIKKKITDNAPPILDALKDLNQFAKENLPAILQKIWGLDKGNSVSVAKTIVEIQEAETNAKNSRLQRFIDDVVDADDNGFVKTLSYEIKIEQTGDTPAFVGTAEQAEQQGIINEKKKEELENTMQIVEAVQKAVGGEKEKKKAFEESYKLYKDQQKMVQRAIKSGRDEQTVLDGINARLGTSFTSLLALNNYIDTILKNGEILAEILSYEIPKDKTTHGRTQSMKSEYQSMIDFVRELNREFDNLRKNFNEKDSAKWAGATNRILSSFEAKFGAMPAKFRKAFQDSLANIDFTTKEGTVEAENIVKGLIDSAKDLTKKEKDELQRAWGEAVGQIKLEAELELKSREDERLKAQVQKMFDDYKLTIELDKLSVDADEVGKLFNIDTKDLTTLERKLESMKEEFIGEGMEKEYRQFMRKIVEINDKANLEMAKKYVKYLREEYGERAKVELEYMRQRAEVYALPFDENETMRIIDNLQKETQKKLDEIDWKAFTGSDMYVELFEDLNKATIGSMTEMRKQLDMMKSSLTSLDPSNMKTLVDQIEKLDDELTKRDPFKVLSESMKSWSDFRKSGETESLINEILGTDGEIKMRDFRMMLDKAIQEAEKNVNDARENVNIMDAVLGAAKKRDSLISSGKLAEVEGLDWNKLYNIEELKNTLRLLENLEREATKASNDEERTEEQRTESQKRRTVLGEEIKTISEYISALEEIKKHGFSDEDLGMSLEDIQQAWEDANGDLTEFVKKLKELKDGKKNFDKISKAAIEAGKQLSEMASNMKNAYNSINDYLESIGVATDAVGEAWKEFGNTMFDTIIQALQMIPQMVASIVSAETAINAAAGWIGLIAEAITLIMSLAKSLAGIHDSYQQREIDNLQKSLDKLQKTAEDLSDAFDNLYDEDKLRQFDAALIKTRELAIATLEDMIAAERGKKKSDQTVIDGYQEQIDDLNKQLQEGIDNFHEALGGFGGASGMKSAVEDWTNAWYDAFKETGDGLRGLEDSFEDFFENIVKKYLMNNIMAKYFGEDFLAGLNSILGTEGGIMGNLDALNDWITQYHDLSVQADEEMQAAVNAIQSVTGIGGGLSGLQASLQGMTEETASALEGYLNSVRFYVAGNNQLLQNLYNVMAIDNSSNPMLQQLKIIAAQATSINLLLDSVVQSGGYQGTGGGSYLKVHAILEG